MKNQFNIAFSIAIQHDYFENGKSQSLRLEPDSETKKIFQQHNMLVNQVENRLEVYYDSKMTLKEQLVYLNETAKIEKFTFDMTSSDSQFYNYTDLPIEWYGAIQYSNTDIKADDTGQMLNPVYGQPHSSQFIGHIELDLKTLITRLDSTESINYRVDFESRAVQWVYYFINVNNLRFENPAIQTNDGVSFHQMEDALLPNNQPAIVFSSTQELIKLKAVPSQLYSLVGTVTNAMGQKKEKVIFKHLPVGNASQINIVLVNDKQVISTPQYVYI